MKTAIAITTIVLSLGFVGSLAHAQPTFHPAQVLSLATPIGTWNAVPLAAAWQAARMPEAATLNAMARPYVTPLGGIGLTAPLHIAHINPGLGHSTAASPQGFSVANRLGATYANPRGAGMTSPAVGTVHLPSPFASVLPRPLPNPFSAAQ